MGIYFLRRAVSPLCVLCALCDLCVSLNNNGITIYNTAPTTCEATALKEGSYQIHLKCHPEVHIVIHTISSLSATIQKKTAFLHPIRSIPETIQSIAIKT